MAFLLSPEIAEFKESLRSVLASRVTSEFRRTYLVDLASGERVSSPDLKVAGEITKELADLGIYLAAVPEKFGGVGLGVAAASAVLEELGRAQLPLPIAETIIFGLLPLTMAESLKPAGDELLNSLLSGSVFGSGVLEGFDQITATLLPNARAVECVLCCRKSSQLAVVERVTPSALTVHPTLDLLREYALFSADSAVEVATIASHSKLSAVVQVCIASELVGIADQVLETAVDYVKTRKQFGVAIGSFQVVHQKLADLAVWLEGGRSLVRFAAHSVDYSPDQAEIAAAAVKGFVSEYVPRLCEVALQLHGGIGFTFEYDLHLFLRRAMLLSTLYGASADCYKRVAELNL